MPHQSHCINRRSFLQTGLGLAAGAPFLLSPTSPFAQAQDTIVSRPISAELLSNAKVAMARCKTYGREVEASLKQCFDLLGGVGSLVKNKTVTVKVNFTGRPYKHLFDKPPGETYLTHGDTVIALSSLLLAEGAKRVRIVECAYYTEPMPEIMDMVGWDVKTLLAIKNVEIENTRNLGLSKTYTELKVPTPGFLFSSFTVNRSYEDTDVFVSLNKLKEHATAGITLAMKNVFGITPCTLYGADAGTEDAIGARMTMHGRNRRGEKITFPGLVGDMNQESGVVVPRTIVDLCAARPIHLSIVDGITSMRGGEGFWNSDLHPTAPGLLIAGFNPVSTDAVGAAVMGYDNPRAERGTALFESCENHLLLAEQAGLGTAELSQIDVRGLSIEEARYPYRS
jgi:uncharacterized protein (DUF362 family)